MSNDRINQIIEEAAESAAQQARHRFKIMLEACESPIEELFMAAMVSEAEVFCPLMQPIHFFGRVGFRHDQAHAFPGESIDIHAQAAIADYRADVLIDALVRGNRHLIVVECDGHDYHERTKEQARRDKQRDRFMVAAGITVLRFTGSEIYADPSKCVEEVMSHLSRLTDR